ncbi:hypothetical protein [Herpetosiphon llansteffanensis]|uniref:hypothetical protein n=1 Tax=Herpetosiphon llansteffanensis TaxID=2094568 RepID=UPI000D7CCD3A|nr:hypothetical protein [Herpetosiphon llansteffanensis]
MDSYQPSSDERQAMRAFLQRAEVRISTMHRIAGVFLNGAGLLILLPVFFRDAISDINNIVLTQISQLFTLWQNGQFSWSAVADLGLYTLLFIPFIATLGIPLYAFLLLLKDIVYFYFANQSPGFTHKLFNPRFILSGLAFSTDEAPAVKRAVIQHQYNSDLLEFILPFERHEAAFYDHVYLQSEGLIVPPSRDAAQLASQGVNQSQISQQAIDRFNTALGLSGFLDRTLIEEVARTEISVVRYALCLRRLVLRYIKALLMFVWTTLLSFILVSFLEHLQPLAILAVGYVVWSALTPLVVRMPTNWIWQALREDVNLKGVARDEEITRFEHFVVKVCRLTLAIAILTLLSEIGRLIVHV